MIDLNKFGKGALHTPPHIKAKHFRLAAEVPKIIDWNKGYTVENDFTLSQRDQDGSSSCTAQATCYYCEALEKIEHKKDERYSARFNYSQSVAPGGGAYIWKAMSIPLKIGVAEAQSVPDGASTEAEMVDSSKNGLAVIEARADKYAVIPNSRDIDALAGIVEGYGGFITGFNGRNDMFLPDGTVTIPNTVDWGHAVWVCGYRLKDGKKCLIFKNSWTANWGSNGYGFFTEDFVKNGPMFDAYTFANIEDIDPLTMNNRFVQVNGQQDVWLVKDGKRSLIYNALAFNLISGEWNKIEKITQNQLDALPDTGKVLAGLDQQ